MADDKTFSRLNLCRETLDTYVKKFCDESGFEYDIRVVSNNRKRVDFGRAGDQAATVDLLLNKNGTTSILYKLGKNPKLGLSLAECLKQTIDPAEFENVNFVLTSIFKKQVELAFSGIDKQNFSIEERSNNESSICWELVSNHFSDRLSITYHTNTHKLQLQGRPLSCYKAFVYCLSEVLDKSGLEKVLTRCDDELQRVGYVQESVAEMGLKGVFGEVYDKLDNASKRLLLSGLCVKLASPNLPDYSMLLYPELRVLEGAMKLLLSKLNVEVGYVGFGSAFEKNNGVYVLTVSTENRIKKVLEDGYCFYHKERHTLFHSNQLPITNRVISTLPELTRLTEESQRLIKSIYELI